MSIVATGKRLAGSSCHLVRRYRPYPRSQCARWGTQLPLSEKGTQQPPTLRPRSIVAKRSPISATAELLCKVDTHGVFFIMLHTAITSWGGLHGRGAELPLCDVASQGAVSSAGVLLSIQRRHVACSVDADRFSCRRRSGNAGVDVDDWYMGQIV